jgi:hypothetical protein
MLTFDIGYIGAACDLKLSSFCSEKRKTEDDTELAGTSKHNVLTSEAVVSRSNTLRSKMEAWPCEYFN